MECECSCFIQKITVHRFQLIYRSNDYPQDVNGLESNFLESSVFSENGLKSFDFGVRPFLSFDNANWRIQFQFDAFKFTSITPPSFSADGININGDTETRSQSGETKNVTKNIFQNFLETDLSLHAEYRFNQYLGFNVKASYTAFNVDIENEVETNGIPNNFASTLDVSAIKIGIGITATLNSHHKKPFKHNKKKNTIQTEKDRQYEPKKQTLTVNVINNSTKEKTVITFLKKSNSDSSYFSVSQPESGKDTIISLPVSQISGLNIKEKEGGIVLKTNDFLASLRQTTDLTLENPIIRKIDEQSVFYESNYRLTNGDLYQAQGLTDPIPLGWVLVAILIAAAS